MKLTPFIRSALYAETGAYADRDAYISDMALSSIWGNAENAEIPADRLELLGAIWDGAHCTILDLIKKHGLTQTGFAQYFNIPLRTVQGWCIGERTCPPYVIAMAAEILAASENEPKPCPYCGGGKTLYQQSCTTKLHLSSFGTKRIMITECMQCPPYADCCKCGRPARSVFFINYCPNCGRNLMKPNTTSVDAEITKE